jgi:hypothetical protein
VQAADAQPIFKTNILNGYPVPRFDGTDDYLQYAAAIAPTVIEIFVVVIPAYWRRPP